MDYLDYEGLLRYHELIDTKKANDEEVVKIISLSLTNELKTLVRSNIGAGTGTITGIKMNGSSKGTSGIVDLGTVITSHQNISGKVDKTTTVNGHALSSNVTVTKSDVGLGNVTNDAQVKRSEMGAVSGVATLDSAGKVPSSLLPSYVDDVLEYDTQSNFPTTGEAGKIYVDKSTSTTWRWSGSAYTQIKGDLAIGTTTGTAADGGIANTHYNNKSNPHGVTKSQVGLGSVVNTGDSATPVSGGTTKFTTGGAYTELNKKVDKVTGKGLSTNDYTTDEKNKLSGIASGAEVNQNAFSNIGVKVGSTTTTVAADAKTDTVTLIQGSNITLTPDASNDTITIAATDTKYTAATSAPGKVATSSAQGSSTNYARQDHTHGIDLATGDSNGQVKIAGTNVSVKGLGSAAYTASTAYATNQQLASDANLNNIKTVGFYSAGGGNTITNKPSGVEHFGMEVIHYASGDYYVQIVYNNSGSWRRRCDNGTWGSWVQDKLTDTTYSSKAAASGGTDVSLVTTGEKATWNAKTSNTGTITGIKMNGASKGTSGVVDLGTVITSLNHTVTVQSGLKSDGTTTISGTSSSAGSPTVALGDSGVTAGTYKRVTVNAKGIVIGGDNSDSNTLNTAGTTNKTGTKMFLAAATELSANPVTYSNSNCYIGTDNCLYSGGAKVLTTEQYTGTVTGVKVGTTSYSPSSGIVTIPAYPTTLPASDVSSWAKASTKPSYNYSEIGYTATETTSAGGAISIDGTTPLQVITISAAVSGITFSAVPENGHSCHLIITASSALSVAIAHGATMYTGYTSVCPSAEDVSLDITAGGYVELDLLRVGTKIYIRGI